jgi:hypothetical protein
VFTVAGLLTLDTPVAIAEPYLTLDGQTAPGDGVCIRGSEVVIRTHDVIVRHMRFRPGDIGGKEVDALNVAGDNNLSESMVLALQTLNAFKVAGKLPGVAVVAQFDPSGVGLGIPPDRPRPMRQWRATAAVAGRWVSTLDSTKRRNCSVASGVRRPPSMATKPWRV